MSCQRSRDQESLDDDINNIHHVRSLRRTCHNVCQNNHNCNNLSVIKISSFLKYIGIKSKTVQ